ncbi:deoxyuridine 5'-triphosphate nucleotidohydrolase [Phtheirospermum japonicum]|uniref:dUTP diphosphatase n=1 Tax=Phtheirospermum japonicum TaxID=374723 RepID=A0A830CMB5_9LAMI|nr:deoxyuridine 5'-triphosphate nucleotidohydrolase [Phtheirospermum japonicum]
MAGIPGAIFRNAQFPMIFRPFNSVFVPNTLVICKLNRSKSRKISYFAISMAQAAENPNRSPEIEEPLPKIQKIHGNGVCVSEALGVAPFLKVKKLSEKAVLPSRGSSLSAGYDLSSATETKVPARGKALIPTDLSIAVPEGTYARVGNFQVLFL